MPDSGKCHGSTSEQPGEVVSVETGTGTVLVVGITFVRYSTRGWNQSCTYEVIRTFVPSTSSYVTVYTNDE